MLAFTLTPGTILIYLMCLVGVVGLIWANKQFKAKGAVWARPLSILFALWTVLFAGIATYKNLNPSANPEVIDEFRKRESTYQTIAAKKFGSLIAEKHSSAKALIIKPKYGMGGDADYLNQAVMNGLKESLGTNVELYAEEKVFEGTLPETEMGPDGMPPEIEEELVEVE